jgi:UBX domain-containing protein 1/4
MPFGYVYESDIGDFLHTFQIRAFPTYVCFVQGKEVQRVEGVNFPGIQEMVSAHAAAASSASRIPLSGGTTLGGASATVLSPDDARALRLARLGVASTAPPTASTTDPLPDSTTPQAKDDTTAMDVDDDVAAAAAAAVTTTPPAAEEQVEEENHNPKNPVDALDAEAVTTLTGEMGFTLLRAQKGLLFSDGGTVESAVEWLLQHQDDVDIDEPIPVGAGKAKSYKCNECGMILSNMANLELHANKTGHSDFEESTMSVKPMTPEEKAAKIAEIKRLLKSKRAEREEAEKVDHVEREKLRRFMGKEMAKTREQMDMEQRKRDALARKREKEDQQKERERIRRELEKDRAERKANKGKLHSSLGVEGYNPSAIQYDNDSGADVVPSKPKETKADVGKIDEYIKKVSSYRAGGDGGKCLKILKAYIGNVADKPDEPKFKMINMDNAAFKTKVKPFIGGKHLLLAVGFGPKDGDPSMLELKENADIQLLRETKEKLIKAMEEFGK